MELEQLRIFCAVAACRSFTRAAKELFVSHSTTSRAVTALERELGVPLLTRDRHTVALTGAGAVLLTGAEALLRDADALADAVAAAEQGVEYTKTIIATKGRASYLGERSLGHQDPGATSFTTMLKVAAAHV